MALANAWTTGGDAHDRCRASRVRGLWPNYRAVRFRIALRALQVAVLLPGTRDELHRASQIKRGKRRAQHHVDVVEGDDEVVNV